MGNIGSLDATIGVNTKALDDAGRTIKDFTAGATNQFNSLNRTISQAKYLIMTLVAGKIASEMKAYISEVTHIAGRYEELGIAMMTAGRNAGYSERNMKGFEDQLRKTGIAAIESRESLTKMAAANMDLYKAADLARAAQNLAVVGGINSSQAFQRLTYAIQSSQVEMLRTIGLNITFEAGYKKTADQLGKTTKELTDQEKMLSRTNAVLEGSALYMGLYEGAMESAEKQMGSMQRYIDNYKVAFGEAFQPAYLQSVRRKTELYKQLAEVVSSAEFQTSVRLLAEYYSDIEASVYGWVTANKDLVAQKLPGWVFQFTIWLDEFKLALIPVEVEIMRFAMLLDKVGGTMSTISTYSSATGAGWGISREKNPLLGALFGSKEEYEEAISWNLQLQERYNKTERGIKDKVKEEELGRIKLDAKRKAGIVMSRPAMEAIDPTSMLEDLGSAYFEREVSASTGGSSKTDKEMKKRLELIADFTKQEWELRNGLTSIANKVELDAWQDKEEEKTKIEDKELHDRLIAIADQSRLEWETRNALTSAANKADLEAWQDKEDEKLKAQEEVYNQMTEFAVQAARNIEAAFADNLFDAMQGNFEYTLASFKKMVDRMVANLIASQVMEMAFGTMGKATSGGGAGNWGWLGTAASAIGNWASYAEGGTIYEPVVGVGTISGKGYRIAEEGPEEVGPVGGRSGGGVRITNIVDPRIVGIYLASSEGRNAIKNIISDDPSFLRRSMRS